MGGIDDRQIVVGAFALGRVSGRTAQCLRCADALSSGSAARLRLQRRSPRPKPLPHHVPRQLVTPRETVEDYLLYRAAELTLQNGFDHFLMVGRDTEAKTSYRYWVDHYGGRGFFYHGFPHWRYGPWYRDPWGPPTYDVQPITTYIASAEIIMIRGPRRDRDVQAFDAREVIAQVGPRVVRPEQQQR